MDKKVLAVLVLAIVNLVAIAADAMGRSRDGADASTRRLTRDGRYEVTYTPEVQPIPTRTLHAWTIEVRTRDGHPVEGATLKIGGGMPDHGHGLPTAPVAREALGGGRYVIDGRPPSPRPPRG
jgi:hypothetical protein